MSHCPLNFQKNFSNIEFKFQYYYKNLFLLQNENPLVEKGIDDRRSEQRTSYDGVEFVEENASSLNELIVASEFPSKRFTVTVADFDGIKDTRSLYGNTSTTFTRNENFCGITIDGDEGCHFYQEVELSPHHILFVFITESEI